jgi:hypothetical protein
MKKKAMKSEVKKDKLMMGDKMSKSSDKKDMKMVKDYVKNK